MKHWRIERIRQFPVCLEDWLLRFAHRDVAHLRTRAENGAVLLGIGFADEESEADPLIRTRVHWLTAGSAMGIYFAEKTKT
jgi:hypothetical protein